MAEQIIVAEGIAKRFGDVEALKGVDLHVDTGTVFGLLGPNGAGKTTMVRILTTLLEPDAGRASVAGYDVHRDAERLRFEIGLAGQFAAVDQHLTGLENLEMVGRLYHLPRTEARRRAEEVLERFGLAAAANRVARTYSGGSTRGRPSRLAPRSSRRFMPGVQVFPTGGETIPSLVFKSTIWLVGIFAVFVPLSVRMYRKNA